MVSRRRALSALLALTLSACGGSADSARSKSTAPPTEIPFLSAQEVAQYRHQRDQAILNGDDSPIPPEKKSSFHGLAYFPFDPEMQTRGHLERLEDPVPVRFASSTGEERPAVRLGYLQFTLKGHPGRLTLYQLRDLPREGWGSLFLPFMDGTTGRSTYGAGRYLDLPEGAGDWFVLDFNLAYHPLCAYGRNDLPCPLTPEENRLGFPIEAGERLDRQAPPK